ncbi:hypothetical protein HDU76_000196 [Blyttiomyces sp. JEL0837]|nr:hypothetical protein HDU76_000196 [Blyttiomyces sp. JEL0837]
MHLFSQELDEEGNINHNSIIVKTIIQKIAPLVKDVTYQQVVDLLDSLWVEMQESHPNNMQHQNQINNFDYGKSKLGTGFTEVYSAPEAPIFITSAHRQCTECEGSLKIQAGKNVKIISVNGIVYNENGLKKMVYHSKEEIERIGVFRLNQDWYITWEAAELWCIDLASILTSKHWNLQIAYRSHFARNVNMPTPKSTQLFQKAYVLYNLICHEDFRFRHQLNDLDRRCSGRVCITVPKDEDYKFHDILPAIQEYVRWYQNNSPQKWSFQHPKDCTCTQTANGVTFTGVVMDGKVMGHQVCRIKHCRDPIVNAKIGFCQNHREEYEGVCMFVGCGEPAIGDQITGTCSCANEVHKNAVARAIQQAYQKKEKNKSVAKPPQTSVSHGEAAIATAEQIQLKYSFTRRYVPAIFSAVLSCGCIQYVEKFFTYESNQEVIRFTQKVVKHLESKHPSHRTILYYDRACKLYRSMTSDVESASLLANLALLVDFFHFRGHNDEYCRNHCNPHTAEKQFQQAGLNKFNTSAAEQANVWFSRISHMLRYIDSELHDFYLFSLIDFRNRNYNDDEE